MKQKPKWQFVLQENEGFQHRMVKVAADLGGVHVEGRSVPVTINQCKGLCEVYEEGSSWRSAAKWAGACDRCSARLIYTFITQVTTDNIVQWATRLSIVDWVYSKTQILLVTMRAQNKPREEKLMYLRKSNIPPRSWMCKKQTSLSLQFYRIRNHFVGCWTANGWITCS